MLAGAALGADNIVPLFVRDDRVAAFSARRNRFLDESLSDVDESLKQLGGRLVVRHGDPVAEIVRVAGEVSATRVHIAGDVSAYGRGRERALSTALSCEFVVHDDVHTVVPPGVITPAGKDHFAVFSAFHRLWEAFAWRSPVATPRRLHVLSVRGAHAPGVAGAGRETAGRKRMNAWLRSPVASYVDNYDLIGVDGTSRLSPYLHFGCVSALELARRAVAAPEFVRQLAWRDFHHQVLAARPDAARADYRPRGDRWLDDDHGDVANNSLNWQWVAGTGTRPNRVLNPLRQAERFDARGEYVRHYLPELSGVDMPHKPWLLTAKERNGYPLPIVDLAEGRARFLAARG
jgi:deoxyribodipyrimidine photo-lyase